VDPVPDPLLLRKSGSAGDRTRDLCICSQKLWPLDHRGGHTLWHYPHLLKSHTQTCKFTIYQDTIAVTVSSQICLFLYIFPLWSLTFECTCSGLSVRFSTKQLFCRQAQPKYRYYKEHLYTATYRYNKKENLSLLCKGGVLDLHPF